jgi:hypothetical protein
MYVTEETFAALQQQLTKLEEKIDRLTPIQKIERQKYSPRELAGRWGKDDVETIRRWCKSGKIKATRDEFSRRWEVPAEEVDRIDANGGRP